MINNFSKYFRIAKEFFMENGATVNGLLFLSIFTFVIIGIDLDSELAVQKDEIDSVVATLTNSINTLHLDAKDVMIVDPPIIGLLESYSINPHSFDVISFPTGRSPPLQNS